MQLDTYLKAYLDDLRFTLSEIDGAALATVAGLFDAARADHRQILLIGNGGSAATASHMACDLGKGTVNFRDPAFQRFRVVSLSDNQALISAIGNDLSFEGIFTEQLKMVMRPGDVVVLISASGNSPNLVHAAAYARDHGAITVGLLGFGGGALATMVDHPVVVSSRNYGIAEDFHLVFQHILTQHLRRLLDGPSRPVAFLDRDGIINERAAPHHYVTDWSGFRFVDGAVDMLRGLTARGFTLMLITNQQGIGRGAMTRRSVDDIHARMAAALAADGVTIAGVYVCPHLEQAGCFCRKPQPGLIQRALNESPFLIDLERSVLVGDSPTDIAAGRAAGVGRCVLVDGAAAADAADVVVPRVGDVVSALSR